MLRYLKDSKELKLAYQLDELSLLGYLDVDLQVVKMIENLLEVIFFLFGGGIALVL